MVFALVRRPTRTPVLDFHGVVLAAAAERLPQILTSKLTRRGFDHALTMACNKVGIKGLVRMASEEAS